jgi:hypothetical protein
MASFCHDCSISIFGKDFGDFRYNNIGYVVSGLCEGCGGWHYFDWAGRRVERKSFEEWVKEVTFL